MTKQKKKKSAKQRRVLIGSVVVAAAIVAGSTFAWFASKDEVTNRLSASANYNVSIAEDFQAPEDWIPGQTINKDVSAVNAGNVDAFVRMWLGGQMRVLKESDGTQLVTGGTVSSEATVTLSEVDDAAKTKLGLTYSSGTTYYKTLSTKRINNPKDTEGHSDGGALVDEANNNPAEFSEVQSVQAGGVLVYAPNNAQYYWTMEQAADLTVNPSNPTLTNVAKDKVVGSPNTAGKDYQVVATAADGNYYGSVDASTFTPVTTGLYLFRRTIDETADGTENKYEYTGYYYDAQKGYFALKTGVGQNGHSDYVLPDGAVTENKSTPGQNLVLPVTPANIKLFTAQETVDSNLTWAYTAAANNAPAKFTVTKVDTSDAAKNIVVEVALANIGTDTEEWTAILDTNANPTNKTTFYYNNDVEAGDTTKKLVDNVKLSENTVNGAYLAFDFDLNVFMESRQVTMNEAGAEGYASVTSWEATQDSSDTAINTGATGADNGTRTNAGEIEKIKWTKA